MESDNPIFEIRSIVEKFYQDILPSVGAEKAGEVRDFLYVLIAIQLATFLLRYLFSDKGKADLKALIVNYRGGVKNG